LALRVYFPLLTSVDNDYFMSGFLLQDVTRRGRIVEETSQISGPTPKNVFGFKVASQNLEQAKALHEVSALF
jgi:hypothetical protein